MKEKIFNNTKKKNNEVNNILINYWEKKAILKKIIKKYVKKKINN